MTDKDRFYKVYSPEKFRPRDDIYLDLQFDIQTPETIEPSLNFITFFKSTRITYQKRRLGVKQHKR